MHCVSRARSLPSKRSQAASAARDEPVSRSSLSRECWMGRQGLVDSIVQGNNACHAASRSTAAAAAVRLGRPGGCTFNVATRRLSRPRIGPAR